MTTHKKYIILAAMVILTVTQVFPCEYNIRDSGFVEIASQPYLLYFYVDSAVPEEKIRFFNKISQTLFRDTNITPETIHIKKSKKSTALEYFRFWNIDSLPALILVSPDKRSIPLPIDHTEKNFGQALWDTLDKTAASPVRGKVLENIVRSYAVILLFEGKDLANNQAVLNKIDTAKKNISRLMTQFPKRIEKPPHLIVLSRNKIRREKILLWSLDIEINGPDEPKIVILFGRGRLFLTPLKGNQVSSSQLTNILSILGLSCDCGLDKRGMMGPRLPLRWDAAIQAQVVKYLGFDAENPMIRQEIAGILSTENFRSSVLSLEENKIKGSLMELDLYSESIQSFGRRFSSKRISPAQNQGLGTSRSNRTGPILNSTRLVTAGAAILAIILVVSLIIFIKRRRKKL
ncbi:MAG: hypothetical protein KAX11_08915 [Candidatus Aminicenantes bacterium]|nr:hypothetical protein [Candidatus Aminicenantes bacterium]